MKILYISHLHPPKNAPLENIGGMQRVSMQLVKELNKRSNITVKTVIQHAPWRGIELKTTFFLANLAYKLPHIVKEFEADIILFSSMVTASLARFTRNRINIPMVTINHGQDVTMPISFYQKFIPKVFKSLDGVISVSEATRQECIKRGMHPDKGIALPNGFDVSNAGITYDKDESKKELERIFKINLENKSLLITVGRQIKRKGHEWFITEVLPKIKSNVVYLAIGDGPEHEHLKKLTHSLPYKEDIFFVGKQSDTLLHKVYAAADVFIMPNIPVQGDMEGFGVVLLEANLASTPAVATDLEGIKDVIEDGNNGYKVPVRDSISFASRVDDILSDTYPTLSQNTRNYVLQKFAWNNVAEEYISYLKKIKDFYTTTTKD